MGAYLYPTGTARGNDVKFTPTNPLLLVVKTAIPIADLPCCNRPLVFYPDDNRCVCRCHLKVRQA